MLNTESRATAPIDFRIDAESALEFRFAMRDVQLRLQQALDARLEPRGVTGVQAAVLDALRRQRGVNLQEVAAGLRIDAPSMSRLVGRLEAKGLCIRFRPRGDRRAVHVELLAPGIALADAFPALLADVTEVALTGFESHERALLMDALRRMLRAPALHD